MDIEVPSGAKPGEVLTIEANGKTFEAGARKVEKVSIYMDPFLSHETPGSHTVCSKNRVLCKDGQTGKVGGFERQFVKIMGNQRLEIWTDSHELTHSLRGVRCGSSTET